jgi:hypothetical protein
MEGWIKVYRKLSEKAFYKKDSEKVHLWVHLLIKATHDGREESLGGKPYFCNPGEFTTGRKQLSEQTGISESKIERILINFEKIEQQIKQQKTTSNRLISILNWNEYQINEQQIEQRVNNDRTTTEQRVNTLQECKNERIKEIIIPQIPAEFPAQKQIGEVFITKKKRELKCKRLQTFLIFWNKYNLKKGKAEAADSWLDIPQLTDKLCDIIYKAAESEAKNRIHLESKGLTPIWAQGWLTARRWEDESLQPKEKQKTENSW